MAVIHSACVVTFVQGDPSKTSLASGPRCREAGTAGAHSPPDHLPGRRRRRLASPTSFQPGLLWHGCPCCSEGVPLPWQELLVPAEPRLGPYWAFPLAVWTPRPHAGSGAHPHMRGRVYLVSKAAAEWAIELMAWGGGCSLGLRTGPGGLFPAPASVPCTSWVGVGGCCPAPTLQVSRAEPRPLYLPWPERACWALRQGVRGKELRGREAPSSLRNWASAHE